MPMILSRLQEKWAVGTTSFEVLVSPPSPGSVGQVVGHYSLHSKNPSGIGAHVEAYVDSSSVTALLA
jgi:hypothetical protein